jgi:hypothetical protein
MSTRSFVGITDSEGGFRGRYVHNDGYPSARGPVLTNLIAQADGDLDYVLRVITEEHPAWSYLHPTHEENYLDERGEIVPRFGLAYTVESGQADWDEWVAGVIGGTFYDNEDYGTEWGYVFTSHDSRDADLIVLTVEGIDFPWANEVARIPVRELPNHTRRFWQLFEKSLNH